MSGATRAAGRAGARRARGTSDGYPVVVVVGSAGAKRQRARARPARLAGAGGGSAAEEAPGRDAAVERELHGAIGGDQEALDAHRVRCAGGVDVGAPVLVADHVDLAGEVLQADAIVDRQVRAIAEGARGGRREVVDDAA